MASLPALLRWLVAMVLVTASLTKIIHPSATAANLASILRTEGRTARGVTLGLLIVEATLGLCLAARVARTSAPLLASSLFFALGLGVVALLRRGRAGQPCGCLGRFGRLSGSLAVCDFGLALICLSSSEVSGERTAIWTGALGLATASGAWTVTVVKSRGRGISVALPGTSSS